jgi:hypothetical protein
MVAKVPRLRRLPVSASFFLEYKRYWPDLIFRIISDLDASYINLAARSERVAFAPCCDAQISLRHEEQQPNLAMHPTSYVNWRRTELPRFYRALCAA